VTAASFPEAPGLNIGKPLREPWRPPGLRSPGGPCRPPAGGV